jgi:hypothetical protein
VWPGGRRPAVRCCADAGPPEQLVIATIRHHDEHHRPPVPGTGTLRGDLIAIGEIVDSIAPPVMTGTLTPP